MRKYVAGFFSSQAQLDYKLELLNYNESGEDVELTFGVSPFIVDWPETDMYAPLMTSGATMKFLTNGVIEGLIADSYRQIHVKLYSRWLDENDVEQHTTVFSGWLTPNIYSQAYDHNTEELELTAIDEIAALQFLSYKEFRNTTNYRIMSAYEIIKNIIYSSDYCPEISEIWLYDTVKIGEGAAQNALRDLYVNEQIFIDEEMSCKEVIEALLKYVNLTGAQQYYYFHIFDRDNIQGITLFKYNVGAPIGSDLVETLANQDLTEQLSDYFSNTVSTKEVYKDVSYTAKFGDFPTWTEDKRPNTYNSQDIVQLIAGTTNQHAEQQNWTDINWTVPKMYATRAKLAECPDNIKCYAYSRNDLNDPVSPYPTFSDYFDVIDKGAIAGTGDATLYGTGDYAMLGCYANIEDTRDEESADNTGVGASDYLVLFVNNNHNFVTQWTPKKLAEIKYSSKRLLTPAGYLDITGTVRFENNFRRIINEDHNATIKSYNKLTTNLLKIRMSIQIGDYWYAGPTANPVWTTNRDTSLLIPLVSNKDDVYFADHNIAKSFVDIDIDNQGFLVDLTGLPNIYGDIKIGFFTYASQDEVYSSGDNKTKYNEITTIFIKDLNVSYINYPLAEGDVEYYNSINCIYENTYEDSNILSTFIDNSHIDSNKTACQHPPCNNMMLAKNNTTYFPASVIYYSLVDPNVDTPSAPFGPSIPEEYKLDRLVTQYSTHTLKFDLAHDNSFDLENQLIFTGTSKDPENRYAILGASIDYYTNLTRYTLVQKKYYKPQNND